jgi:hypothetical protein
MPTAVDGNGLVSTRAKRHMHRRDIIEFDGAEVDCDRPVVAPDYTSALMDGSGRQTSRESDGDPPSVTPAVNEFHQQTIQFWAEQESVTRERRMWMMGFK